MCTSTMVVILQWATGAVGEEKRKEKKNTRVRMFCLSNMGFSYRLDIRDQILHYIKYMFDTHNYFAMYYFIKSSLFLHDDVEFYKPLITLLLVVILCLHTIIPRLPLCNALGRLGYINK